MTGVVGDDVTGGAGGGADVGGAVTPVLPPWDSGTVTFGGAVGLGAVVGQGPLQPLGESIGVVGPASIRSWLSGDGRSLRTCSGTSGFLSIFFDGSFGVRTVVVGDGFLGGGVGAGFSSVGPDGTGGLPVVTGLPHRAITQILTPLGVSIRMAFRFPETPGRAEPTTLPS